jgi:hypothetical protein
MPSNPNKQVASRKKKQGRLQVVDVEPVEMLNRRGNQVYRPKPVVVEKEPTHKIPPSNGEASMAKRRRAPSATVADMSEAPDTENSVNTTKKRKIGGRHTMVRHNNIVFLLF